jgi:hypothetical protein
LLFFGGDPPQPPLFKLCKTYCTLTVTSTQIFPKGWILSPNVVRFRLADRSETPGSDAIGAATIFLKPGYQTRVNARIKLRSPSNFPTRIFRDPNLAINAFQNCRRKRWTISARRPQVHAGLSVMLNAGARPSQPSSFLIRSRLTPLYIAIQEKYILQSF